MNCEVCVYDPHLAPESNPGIEISAYDSASTLLDLQHSRSRGGGDFGAVLSVHGAYELLVDDTSATLAPTSISALNGSHSLRLDVVLYPLPSGGHGHGGLSGHGPATLRSMEQVETHIGKQMRSGRWTELEAEGVRKLVSTTIRMSTAPRPSREIQRALNGWRNTFALLGIDVGFLQSSASYGAEAGTVVGY